METTDIAQLGRQLEHVIDPSRLSEDVLNLEKEVSRIKDKTRGEKGNKGERGPQGERGEKGERGEQGSIGLPGAEGKQGIQGFAGEKGEQGTAGIDGQNGSSDTPDEIIEKVNTSEKQIQKVRIEGLDDIERIARANAVGGTGITTTVFLKNGTQVGRAKNINFIESTDITLTMYQTGDQMNVAIAYTGGGAGTPVTEEDLSSQAPGTSITLAHSPIANTLKLFRGGSRQQQGAGKDYTLSGSTITLAASLSTGETLLADYSY